MTSSCRIELVGGPSEACLMAAPAPAGFDWTGYCVETCVQQGAGATMECVAANADRCDAAGDDLDAKMAIVAECSRGTGGPRLPFASSDACESACESARRECDVACVGGPQCDGCWYRGASCSGCVSAGFSACTDCSAGCGRSYLDCLGRCGG